MVRTSSLLVGTAFIVAITVIVVAIGFAEPYVSHAVIPVPLPFAFVGGFVLVIAAALLGSVLNARAWRQVGQELGVTAEGGINIFAKRDLTGEVEGWPVRVHTYSRGSGGSGGSSTRAYTLVEAELDTPVEWSAIVGPSDEDATDLSRAGGALPGIGPAEESLADIPAMGDTRTVTARDGLAVWGDLSAERAAALLTPRIERAVAAIQGGVSIGDAAGTLIDAMSYMVDGTAGIGSSLAEGQLEAATESGGDHPEMTVTHEAQGLVLDETTLERRIEAVVAVAEAAEQAETGT